MAKTKKQIQRETRRKKTTLKGRKKASMRGGQSKYIFPESLKLGDSKSDFTDITSDEILKKMSSQNYPKFYEELKLFTSTLYNKITNEILKPDRNIRHHCEENVVKNIRSVSENIQSLNQYDGLNKTITRLNDIELFTFLSYLLDYLKIEQDENCKQLKYGRITCKCYNKIKGNKTHKKPSNYTALVIPKRRTLNTNAISKYGPNSSNYHGLGRTSNLKMLENTAIYNRLNRNLSGTNNNNPAYTNVEHANAFQEARRVNGNNPNPLYSPRNGDKPLVQRKPNGIYHATRGLNHNNNTQNKSKSKLDSFEDIKNKISDTEFRYFRYGLCNDPEPTETCKNKLAGLSDPKRKAYNLRLEEENRKKALETSNSNTALTPDHNNKQTPPQENNYNSLLTNKSRNNPSNKSDVSSNASNKSTIFQKGNNSVTHTLKNHSNFEIVNNQLNNKANTTYGSVLTTIPVGNQLNNKANNAYENVPATIPVNNQWNIKNNRRNLLNKGPPLRPQSQTQRQRRLQTRIQ